MAQYGQNEINSLQIIKRLNDPRTLRVDLKNLSSVASTVLNEQIKYETLEIDGTLQRATLKSDVCNNFWHTMGGMVTKLIVHPSFSYSISVEEIPLVGAIFNQFIHLKTLIINISHIRCLSLFFSELGIRNKDLEIIDICSDGVAHRIKLSVFLEHKEIERYYSDYDWQILPELENFVNNSKSLKRFSFPCKLRFNAASCKKALAYFANKYSDVYEVLLESDFLYSNANCYVSRIEIEMVKINELLCTITKNAILKFIEIAIYQKDASREEKPVCIFEHKINTSKTVEIVTLYAHIHKMCIECLDYMIKSFPNCRCFVSFNFPIPLLSVTIVSMAKHMPCLLDLSVAYSENLHLWPVFQQLKRLYIELDENQSSVGIVHLCECCPNLEELRIEFRSAYSADSCYIAISEATLVEIIAKNMGKMKSLAIHLQLKIGRPSLQIIGANLKQLTKLRFGYDENPRDLLELFNELPQLESIYYSSITLSRPLKLLTRQNYQLVKDSHALNYSNDPEARDALEILPEEIWAAIFQKLSTWYKVKCRLVCKRWYNILSTYPLFDRILKLENCVLAIALNPIKTFRNTHLNFNVLSLHEQIHVYDSDLNDFWHHLGRTIKVISIGYKFTYATWIRLANSGMTVEKFIDLQSIEFGYSSIFLELISQSHSTITPILRVIKKLTIRCINQDINELETSLCLDMPHLEYIELQWSRGNKEDLGIPFLLNNCKLLKGLTINENFHDYENINRTEIAVGLFKRIPHFCDLLFLSRETKIKYRLESERGVKNIVKYNYSNDLLLPEIVFTETTTGVSPNNSSKRFKSST